MRNGICGYGVACKYDHPEPVNQYPLQGYGSYAPDELEEHQNEPDGNGYGWVGDENQYVQWSEPNFYYPSAESREYENGYHGVTNDGNANGNQYHQHRNAGWNENQHEIQARTAVVMKEPVTLSDVGLPLRPGKRVCLHYESSGLCKYGRRCKFDHPIALASNEEGSPKPVSDTKTPNAQE
ncbi:zinc finger, CCCH-type containing protein [Tanacetum coccineum]|uniref:Zinc finger, CCCH-type containing protein n=1 Tax=Tanacetum coccineum TaxID=301880 RepID=A0ABQ5GWT2_9ASTR